MKSFYLMNKDTPVLQFTIKDVLGVSSINIDKGFTKVVPLSFKGMVSFNKWIEDRLVLSHLEGIIKMLSDLGYGKYIHNTLNTIRGFKFSKSVSRYEIADRVLQRQIKIAYSLI